MEYAHDPKLTHRLKRIEGQVRGLQKMLVEKKYCVDVITQSAAIRSALSSFEDSMLQNHLTEHVVHQMKGREEKKAVDEIMKVYKLKRR